MSNTTPGNHLIKGSVITGIINACINGIINYFTIDTSQPIYLTQDSISSNMHTVFSGAVGLAISLSFILTTIGYFTTKKPGKIPYFPKVFLAAVKHSVYAFGLVTIVGILIQRYAGQIEVSHTGAAILVGLIAGLLSIVVDYETKKML